MPTIQAQQNGGEANSVEESRERSIMGGVRLTEDAAAAPTPLAAPTSLAALLTSHILHDGETIILILKPSLWFIPLQSMIFAGVVLVATIGMDLIYPPYGRRGWFYFDAAVFLIAGRLMWATLQWMGRLYVLTDMRLLRLAGVFAIDIFDCPLRKVATVDRFATPSERALRLGSLRVCSRRSGQLPAFWQTISRPKQVHAEVMAAVRRAQQSGLGD